MRKLLSSIVLLIIINGCNTSEVKPKIVEKSVVSPKMETKKEDPFEVARKSCLNDNVQACISLGYMAIDKEDYELAKAGFGKAFILGDKYGGNRGTSLIGCIIDKDAFSCFQQASLLSDGLGGEQNYKLAREFYQKAIDLGDTNSLGALATLYYEGKGGKRNYFKSIKLDEKSCNAGTTDINYESCYNAGISYQKGQGVRQDNFKAVKLYRRACNGDYADACSNLGYMYSYGKGVRQSKSTAQMYYGKGCDLGSDMACKNYARNNR